MDVTVVAKFDDEIAVEAVEEIKKMGEKQRWGDAVVGTLILEDGDECPPAALAIFSANGKSGISFPSHHIREAAHRVMPHAPSWVNTPFMIAIRDPLNKRGHLSVALHGAVKDYLQWYPGKHGVPAPWRPDPDEPTISYQKGYDEWSDWAGAVHAPSLQEVFAHYTSPVFDWGGLTRARQAGGIDIMVMGCALFNQPHTDIAEELPQAKADAILQHLSALLNDAAPWVNSLQFVLAGSDFLEHEALRGSLHPFFFHSMEELRSLLPDLDFGPNPRLWGRDHERSDGEIAVSLDHGRRLVETSIVEPLRGMVPMTVKPSVSWTELYGRPLLDRAWQISQRSKSFADRIYGERLETRVWYETLHLALGEEAGIWRTMCNNAVYIADALFSQENRQIVTLDYEVDDQFWKGLSPLLDTFWGSQRSCIVVPPQGLCQPWTY